ncbi:MAG: zinc finger domain-containing protein [Polyangiaceae bacterium]
MSADLAFSLQRYADVCGEGLGVAGADYAAIAAKHGIDRPTWERGMAEWGARLAQAGDGSPTSREFMAMLTAALERSIGPHAPVTLDAYVDISARCMSGQAPDRVMADHGLDARQFTLAGYQWKGRGERDKRLEVYIALRTKKRIAELTNAAERSQFAVIGPGNLMRARRCRNCGALKAVRPTTAYVYCDYCALCFDYDVSVEFRDLTSLDSNDVDRALGAVVADDLDAALRAGDRDAYARVLRWQIEVSIEVCPLAYSPRVKDASYLRRMVDDVLVPWAVITAFDPKAREGTKQFQALSRAAMRSQALTDILALYAVARTAWEHEAALFDRAGLFARHPDGYDATMYLHVNASIFVRPWLAVLSESDQRRLLVAAGVACDYVPAPQIAFAPCGCGNCGRALQVPAGAKRMVCEACGHVLEVGDRQFPCRSCGAPLSLPSGGTDVVCGACNARWVR